MTREEICTFLLTGWVNVENCGIREISKNDKPEEIFGDLCDGINFIETGEYFYFYTNNDNYKSDLECCLRYTKDETAAYELPTPTGWVILFKISE